MCHVLSSLPWPAGRGAEGGQALKGRLYGDVLKQEMTQIRMCSWPFYKLIAFFISGCEMNDCSICPSQGKNRTQNHGQSAVI